MTAAVLAACLIVLLALGLAERVARDRAWREVPIRVHVNGSRGKSTVTRLIWSALRTAGIPALGKTTGTAPRLLLPDGSERAIGRRAPASIREQLALLREARRVGARAVVAECMALDPELQWVSERRMVNATHGVITNVRLDHEEVMGGHLDAIASSLANSIPRRGVLVCGDERFAKLFAVRAARQETRVVNVPQEGEGGASRRWLDDDRAIALAVTRQLGLDDETAQRGFDAAPPDPGAASTGLLDVPDGQLQWLDATAANDPESLARLMNEVWTKPEAVARPRTPGLTPRLVIVYNHRVDRAPRLATFTRHAEVIAAADSVLVTGARPPWTTWLALRRSRLFRETVFVAPRALAACLRRLPAASRVVFCGNTRGFDLARLRREVRDDG